jgi:hypothetical protein
LEPALRFSVAERDSGFFVGSDSFFGKDPVKLVRRVEPCDATEGSLHGDVALLQAAHSALKLPELKFAAVRWRE